MLRNKNEKVSKRDLAAAIQSIEGLTATQAKRLVSIVFEHIALLLAEGKTVDLMGFGKIYAYYVKPRKGTHPKKGHEIDVPASVRVKITTSSRLKRILAQEINRFACIYEGDHETYKDKEIDYKLPKAVNVEEYKKEKKTSPHLISSSLFNYLKTDFVNGEPWIHPTKGTVYSSKLIEEKLLIVRKARPECYKVLYAMWTTNTGKLLMAEKFFISQSTIKRRADTAINTLLLLIMYPNLEPETVVYNFYEDV